MTLTAKQQALAVALRRLAVASDTVTDVSDQRADVLALILNRNEAEPTPPPPPTPPPTFAETVKLWTSLGIPKGKVLDVCVQAMPREHADYLARGGGKL